MSRFYLIPFVLLMGTVPGVACSYDQQLTLLTNTLHNEAHPNLRAQASVMAVIHNRMKMPKWPKSLCGVLSQPNQFEERLKRKDSAKYASARKAAQIFLREMPHFQTEKATFSRLQGYDSFRTAGTTKRRGIVIDGNVFIKSSNH